MNIRRKLLKFLAASPLFANYTASADSQSKSEVVDLSWGHININVSNLDASIEFYEKLGFEVFMPAIPYLGLVADSASRSVDSGGSTALGLPNDLFGRACIMQLGNGFPKLDLTQYDNLAQSKPLDSADLGLVRMGVGSSNLASDYENLVRLKVDFISPPQKTRGGMAVMAICRDPDGTLIELIQLHLDKWSA